MKKIIFMLAMISFLGACSKTARENVGLIKSKPDASQIMTQEQLVLPPDFDTIPVSQEIRK
ncbi:MAG: hypothetical protein PHE89_04425 [Alphaproteobacteria bacterium]|nr:hypothetical protein [Alphaproteobacteria bacterium]